MKDEINFVVIFGGNKGLVEEKNLYNTADLGCKAECTFSRDPELGIEELYLNFFSGKISEVRLLIEDLCSKNDVSIVSVLDLENSILGFHKNETKLNYDNIRSARYFDAALVYTYLVLKGTSYIEIKSCVSLNLIDYRNN